MPLIYEAKGLAYGNLPYTSRNILNLATLEQLTTPPALGVSETFVGTI